MVHLFRRISGERTLPFRSTNGQSPGQRIEGNTWTPSNNNGLTWELSGGVGLCGYCGSRLRTRSPNNSTRKYFYYTCLNESCPFNKHYRKQELERRVGE